MDPLGLCQACLRLPEAVRADDSLSDTRQLRVKTLEGVTMRAKRPSCVVVTYATKRN